MHTDVSSSFVIEPRSRKGTAVDEHVYGELQLLTAFFVVFNVFFLARCLRVHAVCECLLKFEVPAMGLRHPRMNRVHGVLD